MISRTELRVMGERDANELLLRLAIEKNGPISEVLAGLVKHAAIGAFMRGWEASVIFAEAQIGHADESPARVDG